MNQIALIFPDKYFYTVADNRELLPNRCHDTRMIQAFGVIMPYFSDVLLFPLAISTCPSGTYGDNECVSVQMLSPYTSDTNITRIISITNRVTVILGHIEWNFLTGVLVE